MDDELASRVAEYRWTHSIDLGGGVVTPGNKSLALCTAEAAAFFGRLDLNGRSVLDVGAWNGLYSFEAKQRGAARVLATDWQVWKHPVFRGRETFDLARSALGLDIPRILVVDDEEDVVDGIKFFLDRVVEAYVDTAYDGYEAIAKMKQKDYDLVILDIRMPGISGKEVLRQVKEEKPLPDVLLVTAYSGLDIAKEVMIEGAVDCIPKPISLEKFKINVKKILEKKGKYIEKGS